MEAISMGRRHSIISKILSGCVASESKRISEVTTLGSTIGRRTKNHNHHMRPEDIENNAFCQRK
jgi:hypothetical protein